MRLRSQFLLALLGAGFPWMVAGCGDSQAAPPDPPSLSRVSVSVSPKSVVNMPTGGRCSTDCSLPLAVRSGAASR